MIKKSSKNRSKNEGKMGIALGIDFSWIFIDFWRQVGAKLASNIDKKSMHKKIQKMMANKRHLEASWRRLGAVLADLGGVIPRRGQPGHGRGPKIRPPKLTFTKLKNTKHKLASTGTRARASMFGQACLTTHSRRRAERGGGYSSIFTSI